MEENQQFFLYLFASYGINMLFIYSILHLKSIVTTATLALANFMYSFAVHSIEITEGLTSENHMEFISTDSYNKDS